MFAKNKNKKIAFRADMLGNLRFERKKIVILFSNAASRVLSHIFA